MFCPECGTLVPEGAKFCVSCGKPVTGGAPDSLDGRETIPSGDSADGLDSLDVDETLTPEVADLSLAAAQAVGGGIVAVDLLETADGRLLVNEVNHTPEFHGAARVVDVDVAGAIADYVIERAREKR